MFKLIIAPLVAWAIRGNIVAALLGTFVGNPLTFPFIAVLSVSLGRWMLVVPHRELLARQRLEVLLDHRPREAQLEVLVEESVEGGPRDGVVVVREMLAALEEHVVLLAVACVEVLQFGEALGGHLLDVLRQRHHVQAGREEHVDPVGDELVDRGGRAVGADRSTLAPDHVVLGHLDARLVERGEDELAARDRVVVACGFVGLALAEFLEWGVTKYPAKHYMVVMQGPSEGVSGMMHDTLHDSKMSVADLGAAKYSMESMKQCVSDNRQAMLDIHSDLMDVRRGGESEGGAQSLPSYKSAAPGSVRMSGSPTFDELMEAQRSRDVAKDVDASIAEIVAKRGLVNLSLRRERELDQDRNVDESRPVDEPAGTRRQGADEDAEIEEAEQEQGADEDAEIEEAEQEQGADEDAEIEEATIKPKRKNPKSDMEERRRRFPELRPYLGNVTGGEDEFDMEERLRKFPELGPYQG